MTYLSIFLSFEFGQKHNGLNVFSTEGLVFFSYSSVADIVLFFLDPDPVVSRL